MRWSWKIGRIAGVEVRVHATMPLLLMWLLVGAGNRPSEMLRVVGESVALLAIVVLHELGHALVARRYGGRTLDITLLPIGGIARIAKLPAAPRQELAVALAGPAVNLTLAALALVARAIATAVAAPTVAAACDWLVQLNLGLVIFNLLPAFPMDGGRALRALLALQRRRAEATRIAALVARVFAVAFAVVGLWVNPLLLLIALVVWQGATAEADTAAVEEALVGLTAGDVAVSEFVALAAAETTADLAAVARCSLQRDFPIVDGPLLVGLLARRDVPAAIALGPRVPLAALVRRAPPVVQPDTGLADAWQRLQSWPCLPVVRGGALVGLLTVEHVGDVVAWRLAERAQDRHARPTGHPIRHAPAA